MIKRVRALPTPVAGLALGISSLGWSMENALPLHGWGQLIGAGIAVVLLVLLLTRFVFHADTLITDLRHPVLGSIVPTFAMATMVVSKALGRFFPLAGEYLWLAAVIVHLLFLGAFIVFRMRERHIEHIAKNPLRVELDFFIAKLDFCDFDVPIAIIVPEKVIKNMRSLADSVIFDIFVDFFCCGIEFVKNPLVSDCQL